jgi:hypothetical protein
MRLAGEYSLRQFSDIGKRNDLGAIDLDAFGAQ